MAEERVRIEVADHVAVVTLNRPDKHNALDIPMFEGIHAAAERLSTEPGVRAVVLHGAGPSFCSGLDIMGVMAAGGGLDAITEPLAFGIHGEVLEPGTITRGDPVAVTN